MRGVLQAVFEVMMSLVGNPAVSVSLAPVCSFGVDPRPHHAPLAGFALPLALPWAAVVALLALPGFAVKQVVNVIQLRTAAQQLVLHDKQQDAKKARQA